MKNMVESIRENNDLVWLLDNKEFMRIKEGKWFTLSWIGIKLTDSQKVSIIKEQLVFDSEVRMDYVLRKPTLEKIKKEMEKRFKTSYTDIMIKIVTMYSKLKLEPLYGTYEDYDSYNEKLGYCVEGVVKAYERKYGRF